MAGFGKLSAIDLKSNQTVFADVTGFVKRGGMTAVLGASSTGKTVLLKVRYHVMLCVSIRSLLSSVRGCCVRALRAGLLSCPALKLRVT